MMKKFSYTGRTAQGRKVSGTIEAVNEQRALIMLRADVAAITELREMDPDTPPQADQYKKAGEFSLWDRLNPYNPSLADKAFLVYQISAMLESGIDLVTVLDALSEEYEDKRARVMLRSMAQGLRSGLEFSEVLARYPKIFNSVFISVVKAGEESGKLNETLKELSLQMERLYKIRGKVIGALAYPAFTLCVAIIVILIMLIKVIPMFEGIYSSFGAQLPAATRTLLFISNTVRAHFLFVLFLLTGSIVLIAWLWKKPHWRLRIEWIIYRIPIAGPLITEYIYVQICRVLGLLIRSGVHIIDSLRFTSAATPWIRYKNGIDATREAVANGESLAVNFADHHVISRVACRMLMVGEETGKIDDMLAKVAEFYDDRLTNKIKILSSLIEPLLIVILGGCVGLILVAIYMPIFMLGSAMKGH